MLFMVVSYNVSERLIICVNFTCVKFCAISQFTLFLNSACLYSRILIINKECPLINEFEVE